MTSWHELPRAAFDLETTGRNPFDARIVTASIILVNGRGDVRRTHEWLADPGVPIPVDASEIHGITTAYARSEGLPAAQVTREIRSVLADLFAADIPVLAFNASYDFTVLAAECQRHGVAALAPLPVIDPYILDKQVDRYRRGKRTLTAMSEHYGVPLTDAHTSAADVLATLGVASELARRFPQLQAPAQQLHEAQVNWASEQAASFQEYLRRRNPEATVDGRWPHCPQPLDVVFS